MLNKININNLKLILRKLLSCLYINNEDKIKLKITLFLIYLKMLLYYYSNP